MPQFLRLMTMMIVASVFSGTACRAQRASQDMLQTTISLEHQVSSVSDQLNAIVTRARIPSGIESYSPDCNKKAERDFPSFNGTIADALQSVVSVDNSYSWHQEHGVLMIQANNRRPSVVDVVVRSFSFRRSDDVTKISGDLFTSPEVIQYKSEHKLRQLIHHLGFETSPMQSEKEETPILLKDVTVREALNVIATMDHPKVWIYRESSCDGRVSFSVTWTLR